ncbi:MAG: hypothetical protein ACWGQW_14020, partial [bacterium]
TYDIYKDVEYLPLKEFLDYTYQYDPDDTTVETCTYGSSPATQLIYRNDKFPDFYTSGDDNAFFFDSYDSGEETYLATANIQGWGFLTPTFTESDSFAIDLPAQEFSLLRNRAKELAFTELKQVSHSLATREARRAKVRAQVVKNTSPDPNKRYPNNVGIDFGRK